MQYVFTLGDAQIQVHDDEIDLHHHHPETPRNLLEPGTEMELAILEQLDPTHWVGSARIALARKPDVAEFINSLTVGTELPVEYLSPLAEDTYSVNLGLISAVMYDMDYVLETQEKDKVRDTSNFDSISGNVLVLDIDPDEAFIRVGNRQLQEGYSEQANKYHGSVVQCTVQQLNSAGEADVLLDDTFPGIVRYEDLVWGYNNLMVQHLLQEGQKVDMYCIEVDAANRPIMSLKQITADTFEQATEKLETGAVFDMMPILIEETGIVFYFEKFQIAGVVETDDLPLIHQLDSVFMLEQLNKNTLPVKLTHIVPGNEQLMFSPANWVEDAIQSFNNTYKAGDRTQGTIISDEEQHVYVKLADHVLGQLKGEFRGLAPNVDFSIGETIELEIDRIDDSEKLVHVNIHSEYLFSKN
jgi:ribosomal protein S1